MHNNASCGFLLFLDHKRCFCKAEVIHGFGKHDRQNFLFVVHCRLKRGLHHCWQRLLTPVHEEILSPRVPEDVDKDMNVAALLSLANHFFHACNLGTSLDRRRNPLSV